MKKGMLYALVTAVLFVTLEPVSKLIAEDINPYAITFWRFLMGALIFAPEAVVKIRKEKVRICLKDLGIMTALGVLFICISMVSLQFGVKKADSPALIAIIFSSNSVFTILFAMLLLKEKLTIFKTLALVFGVVGVLACADFSSGTNIPSVLLGIFAAFSFSLYTVLSKKYTISVGPMVQTGIVFFMGSMVLLASLLMAGVDISLPLVPGTISILAYLGFLVTGVGYWCYFRAIEKGGVIMGSMAFFVKPILTPFVTLIVNGIAPDIKVFIAVLCVVAASYFASYNSKKATE